MSRQKPQRRPAAARTAAQPFPARLRSRLTELGLTQADFARMANITPTAAWRYCHGRTAPTNWDVRTRIARALKVHIDWLAE